MCIPQISEVPECLICQAKFSRIKARNKHYRNIHSVDVNDLACHPGEMEFVLMKLIREHNTLSLIEPSPAELIEEGLMNGIKSPSDSVKYSDSLPMKKIVGVEVPETLPVEETDVKSETETSVNEFMNYENFNSISNFDEKTVYMKIILTPLLIMNMTFLSL